MKKLTGKRAYTVFRNYLIDSGYKAGTIGSKMVNLQRFLDFLEQEQGGMDLRDVDAKVIKNFLASLADVISERTGKPLARRTRLLIFSVLRAMFKCFYQLELILLNPAQGISYHPAGKISSRESLTLEEINLFLDSIDITEPVGLQDRCMFELMYSSGLRSGEVLNLKVADIDFTGRMLLIREAKWGKDRVVPVNEVAMKFLTMHLGKRRYEGDELVFPSRTGGRKSVSNLNIKFKEKLKKLKIYRKGMAAHSLRHTVSLHLLAGGADLRYVQELLGHESIETTAGYTDELHENLKKIYRQYHPRENDFFREVDERYMDRLEEFLEELKWKKKKSANRYAYQKRWERENRLKKRKRNK